ncbi:MAG: hypothetical protein U0269_19285 [Polyangiales bacterium]
MSIVGRALLFAWELPQNALGLAALAQFAARGAVGSVRYERERIFVEITADGAVSLGWFVFFSNRDNPVIPAGRENKDHEYGHSIQSRWLGPLYLPVVGVPSVARVVYAHVFKLRTGRRWARYYDGFPEDQADRLGGVDRSLRPAP